MAESYNRTLVEAKAATLLIPKSARVLAKHRSLVRNIEVFRRVG